jgi:hypothetical protein
MSVPDPSCAADRSVASFVSLRGVDSHLADARCFTDARMHPSWSFSPLLVARSAAPFQGHERAAAIWSNSASSARPLRRALSKAECMFENGAFLHHYERFGLARDDFAERFADVEQVVMNYESLTAVDQ